MEVCAVLSFPGAKLQSQRGEEDMVICPGGCSPLQIYGATSSGLSLGRKWAVC